MRRIFQEELRHVSEDLLAMGQEAEIAIIKASQALLTADEHVAKEVIAGDAHIDALQRALDERIIRVLAQQAPVATDLRTLVAALRMSATLERMGDYARYIADAALAAAPGRAIEPQFEPAFTQMANAAIAAARNVTKLFKTHDMTFGNQIRRDDHVLDDIEADLYQQVTADDWAGSKAAAIDTTRLASDYVRFGDHTTIVARLMEFLVTGGIARGILPGQVAAH